MKTLGKRVCTPLSLALCTAILAACSSPPPPPPAAPPPVPVRTCGAPVDKTDVMGDVRGENGEVTRVTTTTRCITQ